MADLDDIIQQKYQGLEGNAAAVSNVLTGGRRVPPDMPSADGEFQNGRDLAGPPDAAPAIRATVARGGVTVVVDRTIEFLHFGTTYLDRAAAFPHDALEDSDPEVDLSSLVGGHAIQFRAGLEREAILLGGFLSAHVAALTEREGNEGTLGKVMGVVGDLLGGGGGASRKPEPADLNPYVTQVMTAGSSLDIATIPYDVLHKAGIALHKTR